MTSILDRPIWNALQTRHAVLAEGGPLAKRYDPSVSAFASIGDDSPASRAALAALMKPGDAMLVVQAPEFLVPEHTTATTTMPLVQMTLEAPVPDIEDSRITPLDWQDAQSMFDLASLTKPGPFGMRALAFGRFWGIKVEGQLVAMAGERLKLPGFTELSGVCVHPDFRGKGYARLLSLYACGRTLANGEKPFLHAFAGNSQAIGLYETIGFRIRSHVTATMITPSN